MIPPDSITLQVQEEFSPTETLITAQLSLTDTAMIPRGDSELLESTKQQLALGLLKSLYSDIEVELSKLDFEIAKLEVTNPDQLHAVISQCATIRKILNLGQ